MNTFKGISDEQYESLKYKVGFRGSMPKFSESFKEYVVDAILTEVQWNKIYENYEKSLKDKK